MSATVATEPTTEPVSPSRLRLAIHEAAHGVAAVILGRECEGLKLNGDTSGVAFQRIPERLENLPVGGSMLLLDRKVRDRIEGDIIISLAGLVAVEVYGPHDGTAYKFDATAAEVERIAELLERDGLFRERGEDYESTPPLERRSDTEQVFRLAHMWCDGERSALLFVQSLLAECVSLVRSNDFRRPLRVVTERLLICGALTGAEVHRLVAENDSRTSSRHDQTSHAFVAQPTRAER